MGAVESIRKEPQDDAVRNTEGASPGDEADGRGRRRGLRASGARQRGVGAAWTAPAAHAGRPVMTPEAVRNGIVRAVAVVGLAGVALIHLLDAPGSFQDAPYRGWLYVALIAGSMAAAAALVRSDDARVWAAAAALSA